MMQKRERAVCVWYLEAVEEVGEDLGLHHHLSQVDRVLGDLGQRGRHLPLELGVGVHDQGRQVRHGCRIHHRLHTQTRR